MTEVKPGQVWQWCESDGFTYEFTVLGRHIVHGRDVGWAHSECGLGSYFPDSSWRSGKMTLISDAPAPPQKQPETPKCEAIVHAEGCASSPLRERIVGSIAKRTWESDACYVEQEKRYSRMTVGKRRESPPLPRDPWRPQDYGPTARVWLRRRP